MKRTCLCLALLLTSCTKANTPAPKGPSPTDGTSTPATGNGGDTSGSGPDGSYTGRQIRYLGHVDPHGAAGVWMAWPGTGAEVRVKDGTNITFGLLNQQHIQWNQVDVLIDGIKVQTFSVQDTLPTYSVPLTSGTHTVTLLKRNEAGNGILILSRIDTDGSLQNLQAQSERRLEFIGDTISTGYGVEGAPGVTTCALPPNCVGDPNLENALKAYPVLTAKALNASWSIQAFSGRGVVYNLDGSMGGAMSQIWDRINPWDQNSTYSFPAEAAPQVVVINLGTNDINYWVYNPNTVVPDVQGFINGYVALVRNVRARYADAHIVLAVGPQLSKYQCLGATSVAGGCQDANGATVPGVLPIMENMVKTVIQQLNAAGETKVTFFEFPTDATHVACDYLPDVAGHQAMAQLLASAIRDLTGWTDTAAASSAPTDSAQATVVNTISGNNPPLPDPLANAGDPNVTGINPGQYPECMYCSLQPYNTSTTATCPAVVGEPQACESFCHVPDTFLEPYMSNPPTSGNHYPVPEATLGDHVKPVQRGHYIHSMEHGAVVFAYNCPDGCNAELAVLRQAIAERSGHLVIMTPDPQIKAPLPRFAAMSWTWLYSFDQPDLNSLLCFIDQHELYGRECVNRVCPPLTGSVMQSIP